MIKEIKEKLTAKQYARDYLNFEIKNNRTYSLSRGNNQTCLQFFEDGHFHDYKTGTHGDVIDLCAIYKHGGDKSSAVRELAGLLGIKKKTSGRWKKYVDWQMFKIDNWHKELKHKDYINSRGITDKTIKDLKLGSNEKGIVVPFQKNGYCPYYIIRTYPEKGFYKQPKNKYNENVPWGLHTINNNKDTLYITEGTFDAITLYQEGLSVLSPMGGMFSKSQLTEVLRIAKMFKKLILAFDNDEAGKEFTFKLSKILFENKIEFDVARIETDINNYYVKYKNLNFELLDGVVNLGKSFKTVSEIERFVNKNKPHSNKTDLVKLVESSKHCNRALLKIAISTPNIKFLANEIMKKYEIRFSGGGVYYYYKNNSWNQCDREKIRVYISKELGNFATGSNIKSVETTLNSLSYHPVRYNSKEIWGFQNGVLELSTGKFRAHRKEDNLTFLSEFDYDPQAECPNWINFLESVMNYDEQKITLLQEYAGYVFYPDNKEHQVCLILLGEKSANGKSTFIDAIQRLITSNIYKNPDLISTLEISEFDEQFRRIELKDSILNISSEIHPGKGNGETYFKKVMDGSIINGCRKGTQSINFVSRSKSIFACNEMPKFTETSDASSRRILFVEFNVQFVDTPKFEYQKKKNKKIGENLKKELPGIFNWVYMGYQQLKATNEFTETKEQQEIKKEFKKSTHNVFVFYDEEMNDIANNIITRQELYKIYTTWCLETGHKPSSRTKFVRLINQKIIENEKIENDDTNRRYIFK